MRTFTVTVTTASDGSATAYTPAINGRVNTIRYAKTDFADGVTFTITGEDSGVGLWTESAVNASKTVRPTVLTQLQDGTDHTVRDFIALAGERIKIVIASGGATKTGTFYVITEA